MSDSKTDARLFLLDGMALMYRAHFGLIRSPIFTSGGFNASGVFGFTNTLLELMEKQSPTHLAVAFDTSDPTPRHEIFPEYKANRDAMPEDLALQIPEIKRIVRAFNIPVIECPGWEADDVIGTLSKRADEDAERNFETFMVTPDKDFAQLVTHKSKIYKPGLRGAGHEILDYDAICEKWEVETPEQVVDILGLWGDASDNIPGVPGIGEKTAKKLMKLYGSVEGLLENVDKLKGKQKENVENNREQALLSKKLVKIMIDAPVDVTWDEIEITQRDDAALQDLFTEFEFNQLGKRLFGKDFEAGRGHGASKQADGSFESVEAQAAELKTISDVKKAYEYFPPDDAAGRTEAIRKLDAQQTFCFDLETDGLNEKTANIIGAAFSWKADTGFYIGFPKNDEAAAKAVLEELRPILENPITEKIGHNLKFDVGVLHWHGVKIDGQLFDTMLAHTLVEPDQRHKMDYLSEQYLGYTPIKYDDVFAPDEPEEKPADEDAPKPDQMDMFGALEVEETPDENAAAESGPDFVKIAEYATEDADVTWQLAEILRGKLKEFGQEQLFFGIESPLTPVLVEMEGEGIRIDTDILSEIGEGLGKNIAEMEQKVYDAAGEEFNVASPKQVGEIFFDKLKLVEKPKKTKTGQYKTDEQTLSGLAVEHQIVRDLLAFREASKLKSTYVDALPNSIFDKTGRVHTTFHQLMTATGRLASNDPNLQNIPIRTEQGREIRKAFVPRDKDYILMAADYSQVELRVMASLCKDPAMIEAFNEGIDIHQATAARVFGVELDAVEPSMRRKAKMVNFGIIYGISAFGLAQRLGGEVSRTEAGEIIEEYFKQYPKVKEFQETTIKQAQKNGYVETITKRRRYLRDINSKSWTVRGAAERVAINTPIQGTAADMIKIAMVRVAKALEDGDFKTRMLLQVHDELVFDLHREEEAEVTPLVVEAMKSALPLAVPVVVDTGTGENWLDAH